MGYLLENSNTSKFPFSLYQGKESEFHLVETEIILFCLNNAEARTILRVLK